MESDTRCFIVFLCGCLMKLVESLLCGVYVGDKGCRPHRTDMERKKNESGQEMPAQGGGCPRMVVLLCSVLEKRWVQFCVSFH